MLTIKICLALASFFLVTAKNPEEAGFFEGDIMGVNLDERGAAQIPTSDRVKWDHGIVPYTISETFTPLERLMIYSGMQYLEDVTRVNGKDCIKFVPKTNERNWVEVHQNGGCSSFVGRYVTPGSQGLTLGEDRCLERAVVAHEFMHALGFWHEQSRPDRDDFVTVYPENIQDGYAHNFNKYTVDQVDYLGFPYDYDSVMHYTDVHFSKNGKQTIVPKVPNVVIGQRKHMSVTDIAEIRKFYGCV